jgi:hypothetical protein
MDRANGGVPDDLDREQPDVEADATGETDDTIGIGDRHRSSPFEPDDEYEDYDQYGEQEPLRRQLAQFAFVREEDDREVRLTFRDVPANEIARAFRGSGALLISMMGERALAPPNTPARTPAGPVATEVDPQEAPVLKRRIRKGHNWASADDRISITRPNRHTGELTMRYFFSLNDLVYTINIVAPAGIVDSIAGIYPTAELSEQELQTRLAVVFRETRG